MSLEQINNRTLASEILTSRIIFISEAITTDFAVNVCSKLIYLDQLSHEDITLYLNTEGGDVDACYMITNTMQNIKSDVVTINMISAYSCGALILMAGTKGKRFAFKNSYAILHPLQVGIKSMMSVNEFLTKSTIQEKFQAQLVSFIKANTSMSDEQIHETTLHDVALNASEALAFGLIDGIL